eukprot:786402-Prorocentrum_minimum.AAC.2
MSNLRTIFDLIDFSLAKADLHLKGTLNWERRCAVQDGVLVDGGGRQGEAGANHSRVSGEELTYDSASALREREPTAVAVQVEPMGTQFRHASILFDDFVRQYNTVPMF